MPSDTFFRLPAEKRQRLIDAAWEEFTFVQLSHASINHIIRNAQIPRGSFYQYFANKEDLFFYLFDSLHHYIAHIFSELEQSTSDIYTALLALFDRIFHSKTSEEYLLLERSFKLVRLNPDIQFHTHLVQCPPRILERIPHSQFRCQDTAYLDATMKLIMFSLASAILETMSYPETLEQNRTRLALQLEILAYGSKAI